jgi:hypothetical protein
MQADNMPKVLISQCLLSLTAYQSCGAISHLKTLKRSGGKCSLTNRVVSLNCLVTFCQ